jgi:hypothetical protein
MPGLMKVDLLGTEGQSLTVFPEGYHLHAQHLGVEFAGGVNVLHGQNQMVQAIDFHRVYYLLGTISSVLGVGGGDGDRWLQGSLFQKEGLGVSSSLTFGDFY